MLMKTSTLLLLVAAMIVVPSHAEGQQARPGERTQPQKAKLEADRFQQFRYRISDSVQGKYFAGFTNLKVKDSGSPRSNDPRGGTRGRDKYEEITLERGLTQDASFIQWASRTQGQQLKDLVIDVFDEAGHKSSSMQLSRCMVAEFQSMPDLDGPAHRVTIQVITLHCHSVLSRSGRYSDLR
jgi:phage tail-like protein